MNLRDAPIRQKMTLVIMLTSAVVLLLTAAAFMSYEVISSRRNLLQNSQTIAQITAAQSSAAVSFEDEKACQEILAKLQAEPKILLAALYAKDGKLLARYPANEPVASFPATPGPAKYVIRHARLDLFVPVKEPDQMVGGLFMEWDLSSAYRQLRWYSEMVVSVFITSLAVALLISQWLERRVSVPILELAETAQKISHSGDYSLRAKKYGDDELGHFTDSFNAMLTRIREQDEALHKNQEELQALNTDLEARVAKRTAELAAINQELEAFAYSVSHDLRAPLRHIDAYAQILDEEMKTDPAVAQQYIARIRAGAQNLGRLVDDLLKLSRVGRVEPKFETVPLTPIVNEVLAEMRTEILNRNIDWRMARLPSATVDPGLIKQVFANLISNAVKYTRPRNPAIIEIGLETVGGATAIFVRDNGVGFSMKYAHKLFGVFQRLHRMEDFEGTGVGLATVERIVRLHGGKIWAEAELDKGATFHFTLGGLPAV
jgi:signal transduction histidine kinase